MTDVRGKWALITGASRGIGRLIALEMAKRGCNLVLHSRHCSHCAELLEQVRALGWTLYSTMPAYRWHTALLFWKPRCRIIPAALPSTPLPP